MDGVSMVLASFIKLNHGSCKSCGTECFEGIVLEPCLLQPCFHVAGDLARETVGFHNFNLRIFNLRVSNPNKLIVDALLMRCRISMCQGLGPKKHDEVSEIDRIALRRAESHRLLYENRCPYTNIHDFMNISGVHKRGFSKGGFGN